MIRRLVAAVSAWMTCMGVLPAVVLGEEPVGQLLGFSPGARAIGMGKAQGAIAEEPDAGYWNPAALAFIEPKHAATATYSMLNSIFDVSSLFMFAAYSERIDRLELPSPSGLASSRAVWG
jgi:hypothetical protein